MSVECFAIIHYALRQREGAKSFLNGACHQLHHSISTDEEFLQIWLEPARPQFNLGPRKTDPLTTSQILTLSTEPARSRSAHRS
ncbi:MAG: hypothetical protein E5Y68_03770, partial [Mesorhizobium sp.]